MLFQDPIRILNRHLISREWNHAGAEIAMELVQGRALELGGRNDVAHGSTRATWTETLARDAKDASAAKIKRIGSIKTDDMRGTFDPTRWSICMVPPL
jgi:hypothetical protein